MPQISETRAGEARASRNSCGGWFRDLLSPSALQSQFLIAARQIRPEMAALVASLVFEEARCDRR